MKVAITGSTGLVGRAVSNFFKKEGYAITSILRSNDPSYVEHGSLYWDIPSNKIDAAHLEGHDVVIHLAGANIASKRWSPSYKREIRFSRIGSTTLLCEALSKLTHPPKVLISASAVGFYGLCDPSVDIDESSPVGKDFLANVCHQWEEATKKAENAGIRVIHLRTGVVLSKKGGALAKILPIFKLGLGGKIGSGKQMMSWIALDEVPLIIHYLVHTSTISGPINVTSPNFVSNMDFTKALGEALHRPSFLPAPALAVKLLLGEMGEILLLGGAKVIPKRLIESGYHFKYSDLRSALSRVLS
jgi:uncharacterized protein